MDDFESRQPSKLNNAEESLALKAMTDSSVVNFTEDGFNHDNCLSDVESSPVLRRAKRTYGVGLKIVGLGVIGLLAVIYLIAAIVLSIMRKCDHEHDIMPLIYLVIAIIVIGGSQLVWKKYSQSIMSWFKPMEDSIDDNWSKLRWIVCLLPLAGVIGITIESAVNSPSNLISLSGWCFLLGFLILCSKAPRKIKWRPVLGGFTLQFYFAVLILKWPVGHAVFVTIGVWFRTFLKYATTGASFVLGSLDEHFFAFKVLPVIIFFSCVITMLYYLGIMQEVISKLAFVMKKTLGTTGAESMCAAGNIFLGMIEAPLLVRPFLPLMTRSELHAIMVGGFGTIAGGVMAAFIMKGVPAIHLMTASVMNAPASLAVSKIIYPELAISRVSQMKQVIKEKQPYSNVIEAAAAGASSSISLVANVAANLIAFVALLDFVNSVISWFGSFICLPQLSFPLICHYVLMPLTFMMGVDWQDAGHVGELIGLKTFLNEFYAYDKLSKMIDNRKDCSLDGTTLSVRSEVIATYALCGFCNVSSIGLTIGGLGSMIPNRLGDLAQLSISAFMGGVITNLMSSCLAGLLIVDYGSDTVACLNSTMNGNATLLNVTSS